MAEFDAPQSRNEAVLQNMLGANNVLVPPQSRIEDLLIQILNQGGGGGGEDNVFVASYGTTASGEIATAINARKIIIVDKGANAPSEIAVAAQVDGTRVHLHTAKIRTEGTRTAPIFMKTVVAGTTWTTEEIAVATEEQTPFLATINETTNTQLTAAINAGRPILVKAQGDGQPMYSAIYALKLTSGVVHLITANIVADEEMNNRIRPTFHPYDVDGSTWTSLAPVTALVPRDLTNIVTSLPSTGVANTRYLLKVTDASTVGHHLDEYIYTDGKWVYISKDKTFVATIGTTTAAALKDAINAGKIIYVKAAGENAPCFLSTMVQVAANNDITLNCTELVHDSQRDIYVPIYTRHSVNGTTNVWTSDTVEALPFIATINTTPETTLKAAINSKREILVTTAGTNRPYQTALYAENKGDNGVYLICAKITEDAERWNRLRPTFEAWTIKGTVWTAADPLEAVVEDDLANIMNALPTTGVPKTRYLLKIPDISTEGYHLDEYIYTENKWICISRDNVIRVKTNVTTEAELSAAISAGKTILITDAATESRAVVHSFVGAGYVDLYSVEYDTTSADIAPTFRRHRVAGAVWTITSVAMLPFMAILNVTTAAALKAAIEAGRVILVKGSAAAQSYRAATKAEILTGNSIKLTTCETGERPTIGTSIASFTVYTVDGTTNVWSASTTEGEIYIATIGVTTFAELSTAISSAKPIFVKDTPTGALMPAQRAEANATAAIVQVLITAIDPDTEETTCKVDRYTVTGSQWTLSEISMAIADNYYTKSEIDLDVTRIWDAFGDRRRVLHILVRKNNDAGQFPMGWVAIVTANTQETYASFCTWLYNKNYRSPETSYGFTGGCCGTTGVRNSADTGTAYVGRITSGAYSTNGASLCFKFDYNGTVTDIPAGRCAIISFPLS